MKGSRFASITSSLLVRKGEARPWQMPGSEISDLRSTTPMHHYAATADEETFVEEERRAAHIAEEERTAAQDYLNWKRAQGEAIAAQARMQAHDQSDRHEFGHQEHHDEHTKRCTLRLTPAEYERLGIIGVKREMTRQQILRHAIDYYLAQAKAEFQTICGCLGGECRGDC
jgi:hypothetical protein